MAVGGRFTGRGVWLTNAWISAMLLGAILVVGNAVAREHLKLRVDLSEDQLYAPSPVGQRMLAQLDDLLSVRAFFTGEVRLGTVQIAKRRLVEQLEELADATAGRIELSFHDPNSSSEARAEAQGLGIQAWPMRGVQGATEVTQDVYLGLVLRYGGREIVLPFILPQTFEYVFLGGLRKLLRDEPVTVGFLAEAGDGEADPFTEVRTQLSGDYRLREVLDLANGEAVPAEVLVLVLLRPADLHPRAVFAVDQFLQRGGRAIVLLDHARVDLPTGSLTIVPSGLERALEVWGVSVGEGLVWDQERSNLVSTKEEVSIGGQDRTLTKVSIPYPFWPQVVPEGLDEETPVTARLPGVDLFWVHPLATAEVAGLEHRELMWSSPKSWAVPAEAALNLDPRALGAKAVELLARGDSAEQTLAVAVNGRFPSPFTAGAPEPFDPIEAALHAERVERALAEGREPPERELGTTDEVVRSAAETAQIVVMGDADWASDGKFLTGRNRMLFANLVDWLALEDDLIELRSRVPTQRTIVDFLEVERTALGLLGPRVEGTDPDSSGVVRLESEAEQRAERRRWIFMLRATGASLVLAVLLGGAWKLVFGRGPFLAMEERA